MSEILRIFIASPPPSETLTAQSTHVAFVAYIARRMEDVKKFSNLNIFLSHFFSFAHDPKIADNCWNEALGEDPRWTQQSRYESSLEIKLLFFLLGFSLSYQGDVERGVGLFIYACMGGF